MHTVFRYGFRIFFLSAAAYAVVLIAAWMTQFAFGLDFAGSNPLAWHAHEMLFGVVAAAIAGFLLTAVPNWTAQPRLHGGSLLLLWAIWLAARIGYFLVDPAGGDLPALALRLLDLAFLPSLALVIAVPILKTGNHGGWIFGLITLAAVVRSAAALGLLPLMSSIQIAGLAWIAAFGLFLVFYVPILFAPRADGKPG